MGFFLVSSPHATRHTPPLFLEERVGEGVMRRGCHQSPRAHIVIIAKGVVLLPAVQHIDVWCTRVSELYVPQLHLPLEGITSWCNER